MKHLISILALILAVLSLALAAYTLRCADETQQALETEILEQSQEITNLYSKIDVLTAQVEALESSLDSNSSSDSESDFSSDSNPEETASSACSFLVESWAADTEAVTVTLGYVEVQLSEGVTLESVQLTLRHNGSTVSTASLSLEAESEGVYRQTLTDTWFLLPERADDDVLELYLDVELSDGTTLSALGVTWYCLEDGLTSAVG